MDPQTLKALNAARASRTPAVLVTDLASGRDRVVRAGENVPGALGEAIAARMRSGKAGAVTIEGVEFFLNPHLPSPRLVAIGAVHISQALAPMARAAGFEVTVVDPRTAFATTDRFAVTELIGQWPDEALARRPLDPRTALAALTHDPKIDDAPLLAALRAECFYVGALGSRKTHAKRRERLAGMGAGEALLDRIEAPIGLDIGAAGPAEIAVAVLASVIRALRGPKGHAAPSDPDTAPRDVGASA